MTPNEALAYFKDQPYKQGVDPRPRVEACGRERRGNRRPRLRSRSTRRIVHGFVPGFLRRQLTREINPDAINITYKKPAGAYWRGERKRPQLTHLRHGVNA
ncbi:MAG: hypothetical protein U0521_15400 [Anaerolineae bacterium]